MGVSCQLHIPATLPVVKAGAHSVGGWVDLRAGQDVMEKNLFPLPGIEPRFLGRPARRLVYYAEVSWLLVDSIGF
jgi:hypothetical protein